MITGNVSKTFVYTLIVIACFKKIFIVCKKATTTTNTILLKFLFSLLPVVKILTFITGNISRLWDTQTRVKSFSVGVMFGFQPRGFI